MTRAVTSRGETLRLFFSSFYDLTVQALDEASGLFKFSTNGATHPQSPAPLQEQRRTPQSSWVHHTIDGRKLHQNGNNGSVAGQAPLHLKPGVTPDEANDGSRPGLKFLYTEPGKDGRHQVRSIGLDFGGTTQVMKPQEIIRLLEAAEGLRDILDLPATKPRRRAKRINPPS